MGFVHCLGTTLKAEGRIPKDKRRDTAGHSNHKRCWILSRTTWPKLLSNKRRDRLCRIMSSGIMWEHSQSVTKGTTTCTAEQARPTDGSQEASGPRPSHKVTVLPSTGKHTPELSSVAHEETIPEEKNMLCDKGDSQPAHGYSSLFPQCQQPRPSQTVDPSKKKYQETSHCCYSKVHIFVLKQSITGADPNKPCIMVILYKLQKSQEIGQPLPFLHENYHCSLQCVFLQTFLEPSPTHNIYTYIFFQP